MSCTNLLPALLLALTTSAWASGPAVAPELRGILATGKTHRFAVVTSGGAYSGWIGLGDTIDGWKLVDYLPAEDAIVLSGDERRVTVRLNESSVTAADVAGLAKASAADADALLNKMKFEALWDRIAEEQKKGIIVAMRQQAAPEFTRMGLSAAEIDGLLDRMGEAVVGGMQSEAMRKDFARVYADVYTKDELRGMADFCDTAAGRAWMEKQPEVQQKLMQVLMPRAMAGMPAAQKIAADYFRQRAAASAPVTTKP